MRNYRRPLARPTLIAFALATGCSTAPPDSKVERAKLQAEALSSARLPSMTIRDQVIYYVMPDRFSDGDPGNNYGEYSAEADVREHGFDKSAASFYHGGDLAGLTGKLDYIQKLGASSIWSTPLARNRTVAPDGSGAGYHGYWPIGFDQVDPHFGTASEMKQLVGAAHARGMKVILDVVANHTADVISYEGCGSGCAFRASPPYTPLLAAPWKTAKSPAWLNDLGNYHHLGNMNDAVFASLVHGDFGGLDDLKSSSPAVVSGLADVFKDWISNYDVDGFRLDAAKHVDDTFWRQWWPVIEQHALSLGKADFYAYAEVYDTNPETVSRFTGELGIPSAQDLNFMDASRRVFSQGAPTDALRWLFEGDDYFTDADSNAYYLTTMLSSHDAGRIGAFLVQDNPSASDRELLQRDILAHAFLLVARGVPAVYYGDEQGFTGINAHGYTNFETARQDMFPSLTPAYTTTASSTDKTYNRQIGADSTPAADNFDRKHPLYQAIGDLARLRSSFVELRRGAQLHRHSSSEQGGGVYALSRIMRPNNKEFVVVLNSSPQPKTASIRTLHDNTRFVQKYGNASSPTTRSDAAGYVMVTLAPFELQVWMASAALPTRSAAPAVAIESPAQDFVDGKFWIGAGLSEETFAEVDFYIKEPGASDFRYLGKDDNAPYRVRYDASGQPLRSVFELKAVVHDYSGNSAVSAVKTATLETRLKDLKLVYQNGNDRSEVFALQPSGQVWFPQPVVPSGNSLPWPPGADALTFFYDTPNPGTRTFAFDQPFVVRREHILANAQLTTDGLSATLYVNNAGEVAGAPNDVASAPAVLQAEGSATSPLAAPVYLRGEMNGWGTAAPLEYVGEGTFVGSVSLLAANYAYQFKFASADWGAVNLGGGFNLPAGLWAGGNNLSSAVPEGQTGAHDVLFFSYPLAGRTDRLSFYRFQKAATAGQCGVYFSVSSVPDFSASQVVYVAGDDPALGPWSAGAANALHPVAGSSGTYSGTISLQQGQSVNFKFIVTHDGTTEWESGWSNRWLSVPRSASATYSATWNVIEH